MADDQQFLGRGWGFPVTFGNQGRAVTVAKAEEDIRQSLEILLSTTSASGCSIRRSAGSGMRSCLSRCPRRSARISSREIETAILFFESRIDAQQRQLRDRARPGRADPHQARLHDSNDEHADQSRVPVLRHAGHQRMTTDLFRRYGNLLRSDGTNQLQRLLPALDANYIVPDERSFSDLVEYARNVAAEIRYYDLSGQSTGDWTPFVEPLLVPGAVPSQVLPNAQLDGVLEARTDWPPHLVLFLAFLKQFQNLQGDLNQLTENHLRYYYETELGLQLRDASPDDVHVVFELAKNADPTLVPAGTLLDAGKDDNGRPLAYATQNELVVSAATVSGIKRLVMEQDLRRQSALLRSRRLHRPRRPQQVHRSAADNSTSMRVSAS